MSETVLGRVVYIVDSDQAVREALSRLVDSAGLESKPYASVDAFLREMPWGRDACALLEVSSPDLRDPMFQSRLRAITGTVPIIALSSRDDPETRRMAREIGAQAFFRKPVDGAALLDSIDWTTRAEARSKSD